ISPFRTALGQAAAAYYFIHFLVILPLVSKFETPLPLPTSITDSVLHGEQAEAAPAGQKATRGGSAATATAEQGGRQTHGPVHRFSRRPGLRRGPADLADQRCLDLFRQPARAPRVRRVP